MIRIWNKGISNLSKDIIKIRFKIYDSMWSDYHRVRDRRSGIRIVR